MQDKSNRRNLNRSNQTLPESRQYKILKIIFSVIIILCLALAISMMIVMFIYDPKDAPYFITHYAVGLSLILVGIVAILMTILNKYNINSSDKGDKMMKVVGLLLIVFGVGTIIFSYLS